MQLFEAKLLLFGGILIAPLVSAKASGDYLYVEGVGATESEANQQAKMRLATQLYADVDVNTRIFQENNNGKVSSGISNN